MTLYDFQFFQDEMWHTWKLYFSKDKAYDALAAEREKATTEYQRQHFDDRGYRVVERTTED